MRLFTILLLLLPLAVAGQQIFRTVDEKGNVVFTDRPPADSGQVEEVELNRTNRAAPPPRAPRPSTATEPEPTAPETLDYRVSIDRPDNETTIPMGPGNFTVTARVSPALQPEHRLQLRLNGEDRGEPQRSEVWELTNVFRGAHDITVSVTDADGEVLATSEPVRVYVLRPSVNFRN